MDYASQLKGKFKEYDEQSERYYTDVLDRFKTNASNEVQMREREIERLNKLKEHYEGKIGRLIMRVQERKIKRLLSDVEDESDGEFDWTKEIDDTEFKYIKAQRRQFKA